jgi:abortive infection bacteriophage resistance protein
LARTPFIKVAISLDDQIQLLLDRGVIIDDRDAAKEYLQRIGYYRFSGYTLPYQKGGHGPDHHEFKVQTPFESVLDRYVFDRKFRLLLLDAIERIEVATRSILSNQIAERHSPHWYTDPRLFVNQFNHANYIGVLRKQINIQNPNNQAVFIKHYYSTYSTPNLPPSWMVFEDVSFGVISKTVEHVIKSECGEFGTQFGLSHQVLTSWLHALSYVRNLCAHHSRVWNRVLTIKPIVAKRYKGLMTDNSRIYSILIVAQVMLRKAAPDNHWATRLRELLDEHPDIPLSAMGIPENWYEHELWGLEPALNFPE